MGDRPRKIPHNTGYRITATRGGKIIATEDGLIPLDNLEATGGSSGRGAKELIVSCLDLNDVRRFDAATGQYLSTFASGNGLKGPGDMQWGPDGNLYVATAYTNSVVRFNGRTGQFIDEFVPDGSGGLNNATGLVFGPDGNLYVTSTWDVRT